MKQSNLHVPNSVESAKEYHSQFKGSPAEAYLTARGLAEGVGTFLPGFVSSALTGHERYRDHLVIPYLRPAGGPHMVATLRFRCIRDACVKAPDGSYFFEHGQKEDHGEHSKYMSFLGDPSRLYNTKALIEPSPYLALVEGELSAWAMHLDGIPAVAVQGVSAWKDYFDNAFIGYEKVFIVGDGDAAGAQMVDKFGERFHNAVPIDFPQGEDPDSYRLKNGPGSNRKILGLED
ncbi:topoisomerase [Streptomyces sp. NPDC002644]